MQTQEKPVEQKIDPKKKYQLAASPGDSSGVFWLHISPEGDSSWVQFPFEANKQPTFLSMQQISQVAVGANEKIIWFLTDETGQGYRYVPLLQRTKQGKATLTPPLLQKPQRSRKR